MNNLQVEYWLSENKYCKCLEYLCRQSSIMFADWPNYGHFNCFVCRTHLRHVIRNNKHKYEKANWRVEEFWPVKNLDFYILDIKLDRKSSSSSMSIPSLFRQHLPPLRTSMMVATEHVSPHTHMRSHFDAWIEFFLSPFSSYIYQPSSVSCIWRWYTFPYRQSIGLAMALSFQARFVLLVVMAGMSHWVKPRQLSGAAALEPAKKWFFCPLYTLKLSYDSERRI